MDLKSLGLVLVLICGRCALLFFVEAILLAADASNMNLHICIGCSQLDAPRFS